ncbi:MAG: HAMP domain-containing histidine kinase [Shimia sp.]|nr:HAMP domain-containing histidine kinase [Shimia sp.]
MFVASVASVYFHQSAAATTRYVLTMGQMVEAVSKLKGHAAQLETSRGYDAAEAQETYVRAFGYYSALRAADPDGDEIEEDTEAVTRQALNERTREAGVDPIALGTELGLLGNEMPEILEDIWEEEEETWEAGAGEEVSLENVIGTILLAAAEIFADGKTDPSSLEVFWAEVNTLSSEQIDHVNAVLTQQSQTAGELPVFLSVLVFVIALFAAVFAWFTVARPLVAEILRIQSELQEEAQAARASDMAKTQFLATISHELRTPMNGVIGAAQLLELVDLPEEDRELIDILNSCADSQMALIEEILTFGEIEAGALRMKSEPIEVKGFMKNATSFATILAQKKDLSFHLEVPENTPEILGDAKRLQQVVVNLVGNAVKFTDAGSVHVSATVVQAEGTEDAVFSVAVTDTGAGIAPEDQAKIFERFVQADSSSSRKAGGTGLGLSIAQGIAQEANGDITLESEVGKGSTFTLTIPTKLSTASNGASQNKRNAA